MSDSSQRNAFEVGVLGSAHIEPPDRRWDEARELGALLARGGYTVVTGGYGGLMAAVSQGAHENGGKVIGLPMRHWGRLEPNVWNAELRWADSYGSRLEHLLTCRAVIALPGGVGTLSELSVAWAAAQTEANPPAIVALGDCWPPMIEAIAKNLVVGRADLSLVRLVANPAAAIEAVMESRERPAAHGPGG
jgi:uncharacterized protein (TIGR00730 family)